MTAGCVTGNRALHTVVVLDDTGQPVEKAEVFAVGTARSARVFTGRDGTVHIPIPNNVPIAVVVHCTGYDPTQMSPTTNTVIRVVLFRRQP